MINKHMVSEHFDSLFKEASRVREQAHVPYSKFKVGAAFLTEDNKITVSYTHLTLPTICSV